MKLIKKVTGIDTSKDSFTLRFGTLDESLEQKISKPFTFSNDEKGFKKLIKSTDFIDIFRSENSELPVWFVLEATGVYYENLAYFLKENNFMVSVVLPNKIKNFSKTLENKSKTDSLDAKAITQYGLEKALKQWVAPSLIFKKLKELTRERISTNEILTQLKNRKHAKDYSHDPNEESVKRLENQILFFKKQLKQIEQEIKDVVKSDNDLNNKIKKIMTIKGAGLITVVSIIAETNGFDLIENYKQLTSYAGLDVMHDQSGYHTGKTRISKKGNKYLRNAVYLPAICASRFNEILKPLYIRLCISKNNKKIAIVAVARKLLILIYTLWKKDQEFNPNFKSA